MEFQELVRISGLVAATRSRTEKRDYLADLLRDKEDEDVDIAVAYLTGELRQQRTGIGAAAVRAVAPESSAEQSSLSLRDVDAAFEGIAGLKGKGSRDAKIDGLRTLYAVATRDEQRFLSSLVAGDLRQGALEGVLVEAIARAAELPPEEVRRAAMLGGELRGVAATALAGGDLGAFRLQLFRPIQPMLAQSAESPAEALEKLGTAAFEWKLDGVRVQVHRRGRDVRIFTRRLHDVTAMLPDVVASVLELESDELVLDGEVLTLDETGAPRPFQTTMRRFGRRIDVEEVRAELPLHPHWFDLLHADGSDVLDLPLLERLERLETLAPGHQLVPRAVTNDPDEAAAFFESALAKGHEGVMAKSLTAAYEAGRRGAPWLKIKPAHTLDLAVLAAEWGSGRRSRWLSNLHLGARDEATGELCMVGKTFKGMTDEVLGWQTEALAQLETGRIEGGIEVEPRLVVEVAIDGVQKSPRYPGGAALRFARLRRYRPDKGPTEVDTIATVRAIGGLS